MLVLTRERQVLVLQIEALRAEAQQAEKDLQDQYDRHRAELHCLREESLQVGEITMIQITGLIRILLVCYFQQTHVCLK